MTSPRFGWTGRLTAKSICLRALTLAAIGGAFAAPCDAQDSAAVAAPAGTDSAAARPAATGADTAGRDSVKADTAARARKPAPPPAPVDSAVGVACQRSGGADPDLLLVTFRADATAEDRAAVAEEVGGKLVARSEHGAPGAWYLRVPGSAARSAVADELIMMSPVQEVGETQCPA